LSGLFECGGSGGGVAGGVFQGGERAEDGDAGGGVGSSELEGLIEGGAGVGDALIGGEEVGVEAEEEALEEAGWHGNVEIGVAETRQEGDGF